LADKTQIPSATLAGKKIVSVVLGQFIEQMKEEKSTNREKLLLFS